MKKSISLTIAFLIFGFAAFLGGCAQKTQLIEETVLAEFDDTVITLDNLDQEISELLEYKQSKYESKEGREEYLTLMAESRMLLQVAQEKGLNENPEILKQTQEYKDQLLVKELVKREVEDKVKVTDAGLQKYYAEHKADYLEPEKVIVTEITVTDEEKAKEVLKQIGEGADFTELAKEIDAKRESLGPGQGNEGKTRPFGRNSYSSAQNFVETAFSLEIGKISDIVVQAMRDETYYMIIRLDERIPERQREFSEVEKKIRSIVAKQVKADRMDKWLTGLKVEKKFQLYPDRIPEPVEPVEEVEETTETPDEQEASGEQEKSDEAVEEEKADTETEESKSEDETTDEPR